MKACTCVLCIFLLALGMVFGDDCQLNRTLVSSCDCGSGGTCDGGKICYEDNGVKSCKGIDYNTTCEDGKLNVEGVGCQEIYCPEDILLEGSCKCTSSLICNLGRMCSNNQCIDPPGTRARSTTIIRTEDMGPFVLIVVLLACVVGLTIFIFFFK